MLSAACAQNLSGLWKRAFEPISVHAGQRDLLQRGEIPALELVALEGTAQRAATVAPVIARGVLLVGQMVHCISIPLLSGHFAGIWGFLWGAPVALGRIRAVHLGKRPSKYAGKLVADACSAAQVVDCSLAFVKRHHAQYHLVKIAEVGVAAEVDVVGGHGGSTP